MATGPEHYREAERILAMAEDEKNTECAVRWAGEAQVHATLALAAATALCGSPDGELDDPVAWERAAGEFSARRALEKRADLDAASKSAADAEPCGRCGAPGHNTNDCEDERPAQEWLDAPTEGGAL